MGDSPEAASALSWIPQLFYDVIGRVVPGAAVLISSFLLLQDLGAAEDRLIFLFADSDIPSSVVVLIGLLISYLLGVLLGAVGFFFQSREWETEPPELSSSEQPNLKDREILRSFMYDAVQLHDPQAGSRLAKLSAEQHMCRVLIVGFIVVGLAHVILYLAGTGSRIFWAVPALCLVVMLCSWMFHRHLSIRGARLLANHWWSLELAKKTRLLNESHGAPNTAAPADQKASLSGR